MYMYIHNLTVYEYVESEGGDMGEGRGRRMIRPVLKCNAVGEMLYSG